MSLNDEVNSKKQKPIKFRDCRPESSKKSHPLNRRERALASLSMDSSSSIRGSLSSTKKVSVAANRTKSTTCDTDRSYTSTTSVSTAGGIIKTVILPFDEINNIKSELEYLKQYRDSQKALYEETIASYQKDKVIRLKEFAIKEQDLKESA